jgi:hypothetical protein
LAATTAALLTESPSLSRAQPPPPTVRYTSPEEIDENFLGRRFLLGENDRIAEIGLPDWPKSRYMKLPFWLGTNILLPGFMQPKEGEYYVVSEARLLKKLDDPREWLIEAGSSLLKKETVFITTKTDYRTVGKILPTIVQYAGMRQFKDVEGRSVSIPVLREVSLPMKWTADGGVPQEYARFAVR